MINPDGQMQSLAEVDGFTNNESAAVHNIYSVEQAVLWLAACAIQLQGGMKPPTYEASLSSRVRNIKGVFDFDDRMREDQEKRLLWRSAFSEAQELSDEAKTAIYQYLSGLSRLVS